MALGFGTNRRFLLGWILGCFFGDGFLWVRFWNRYSTSSFLFGKPMHDLTYDSTWFEKLSPLVYNNVYNANLKMTRDRRTDNCHIYQEKRTHISLTDRSRPNHTLLTAPSYPFVPFYYPHVLINSTSHGPIN